MPPDTPSALELLERIEALETKVGILEREQLREHRRGGGVFDTVGNPFVLDPFRLWAEMAGLPDRVVLEPFAGRNSIVESLRDLGMLRTSVSFDIEPRADRVERRDTLHSFPTGYEVCVTNPPWLHKSACSKLGLDFAGGRFDDLYEAALDRALSNCKWVAMLLPANYIRQAFRQERLHTFVLLHAKLFRHTETPTCLALFHPEAYSDVDIWFDNRRVGFKSEFRKHYPFHRRFNLEAQWHEDGPIVVSRFDTTHSETLGFTAYDRLADYITRTGHKLTPTYRLRLHPAPSPLELDTILTDANQRLTTYRRKTEDALLRCWKGLRRDGRYRRSLSQAEAVDFLVKV